MTSPSFPGLLQPSDEMQTIAEALGGGKPPSKDSPFWRGLGGKVYTALTGENKAAQARGAGGGIVQQKGVFSGEGTPRPGRRSLRVR